MQDIVTTTSIGATVTINATVESAFIEVTTQLCNYVFSSPSGSPARHRPSRGDLRRATFNYRPPWRVAQAGG